MVAHARQGATDVCPFVPVADFSMEDCVELARRLGKRVGEELSLPVFLYERSATAPHRSNLAAIRKGQFEGMAEKIKLPEWKPDYGPAQIHPSAGATAIGARMPLVAYNVNLDSSNIEIANEIAKRVRHISGGYRYVRAMGVELSDKGMVQVSMNVTNYEKTPLPRILETIRAEAARYGVNVAGTELIGAVPLGVLEQVTRYYLQSHDLDDGQIVEMSLLE